MIFDSQFKITSAMHVSLKSACMVLGHATLPESSYAT